MSFLDEGTFVGKGAVKDALKDPEFKALKGDEKANALKTLKMGGSVTTEIEEANAFLAAADAARDKGDKKFEFPKGSGKIHKVTLKRDLDLEEGKLSTALGGVAFLASLLLMGKINSSDPVLQRLQAEYEQADPAQQDSIKNLMTKRILFLDTGKADNSTPMKERRGGGSKIGDALFGKSYERPFSDLVDDIDDILNKDETTSSKEDNKLISKIAAIEKGNMSEKEFNLIIKKLKKAGMSNRELKELEKRYKATRKAKQDKKKTTQPKPTNEGNCGCGQTPCKTYGKMKEAKEEKFDYKAPKDKDKDDIKIDPDTEFKIDLKHLIQKHMKEGKSKEDTIKLTKKLMAKLHNKGEIKIDGTTLIFKEADVPQDTQLALPEPPEQTANFLGNDNMDYEGGMAKSQMLKMKNYQTC